MKKQKTPYKKKDFLQDVAKEARALRKNAKNYELDRLDLRTLNPAAA